VCGEKSGFASTQIISHVPCGWRSSTAGSPIGVPKHAPHSNGGLLFSLPFPSLIPLLRACLFFPFFFFLSFFLSFSYSFIPPLPVLHTPFHPNPTHKLLHGLTADKKYYLPSPPRPFLLERRQVGASTPFHRCPRAQTG